MSTARKNVNLDCFLVFVQFPSAAVFLLDTNWQQGERSHVSDSRSQQVFVPDRFKKNKTQPGERQLDIPCCCLWTEEKTNGQGELSSLCVMSHSVIWSKRLLCDLRFLVHLWNEARPSSKLLLGQFWPQRDEFPAREVRNVQSLSLLGCLHLQPPCQFLWKFHKVSFVGLVCSLRVVLSLPLRWVLVPFSGKFPTSDECLGADQWEMLQLRSRGLKMGQFSRRARTVRAQRHAERRFNNI